MYLCIYVYTQINMSVCVYVYIYIYIFLFIYLCVYIYIHIYRYTDIRSSRGRQVPCTAESGSKGPSGVSPWTNTKGTWGPRI